MACLTNPEIEQWHRRFGQADLEPAYHLSFCAPVAHAGVEALVRWFLDQMVVRGELLVVLTDAAPAEPCHEFVSDAVRQTFGESRPPEDAPGYLMQYEDCEKAIGLFSIMSSFRWKCYLYADHDFLTLGNWEGEIFEIWTSSETKYEEIRRVIQSWGLREIKPREKGSSVEGSGQ